MKKQAEFRLYGIFGNPLGHTLSPVMQEAAFETLGEKAFYLVLETGLPGFRKFLKSIKHCRLEGFNVTVPYKEEACRLLKHLLPDAKAVGAVNTVFKRSGKWIGTNTDVYGFLTSLEKDAGFNPQGKQVLVLGSGGSARAVVFGLALRKVSRITLLNRHAFKAKKLAAEFKKKFNGIEWNADGLASSVVGEALKDADLIVQCTPLGMKPGDGSVLSDELIPKAGAKKKIFFDLIYRPAKTKFLTQAEARGHKVINGAGMLVYQGAKSFEYWTGKRAPVAVMKKTLCEALEH